jgi:hypothetical protein
MIHSVSRRPVIVESQVPSHATAYGIYGGKVSVGTGFSLQKLQFIHHQRYFTNNTDTFIYHSRYKTLATERVVK